MSLGQGYELEEVFESAVLIVRNLPKEGPIKPSDDLKLKLYALFKQATHGPNDTAKPRFYQIVEAYKWDAWNKLGNMSREEAMSNYISELKNVMDTIPKDDTHEVRDKQFEDVLGKKFYDYWFNQWQQSQDHMTASSRSSEYTATQAHCVSSISSTSSSAPPQQQHQSKPPNPNNDTQSQSSSGGSSVSMLEDTAQVAACDIEEGGYKTPTSLDQLQASITGQMGDQFSLAVLRLQHSLTETNSRLDRLEEHLNDSLNYIRSIQTGLSHNQTKPKQLNTSAGNEWSRYFGQLGTINWFYLSYPVLVYFLMRLLLDRRQRRDNYRATR